MANRDLGLIIEVVSSADGIMGMLGMILNWDITLEGAIVGYNLQDTLYWNISISWYYQ